MTTEIIEAFIERLQVTDVGSYYYPEMVRAAEKGLIHLTQQGTVIVWAPYFKDAEFGPDNLLKLGVKSQFQVTSASNDYRLLLANTGVQLGPFASELAFLEIEPADIKAIVGAGLDADYNTASWSFRVTSAVMFAYFDNERVLHRGEIREELTVFLDELQKTQRPVQPG